MKGVNGYSLFVNGKARRRGVESPPSHATARQPSLGRRLKKSVNREGLGIRDPVIKSAPDCRLGRAHDSGGGAFYAS